MNTDNYFFYISKFYVFTVNKGRKSWGILIKSCHPLGYIKCFSSYRRTDSFSEKTLPPLCPPRFFFSFFDFVKSLLLPLPRSLTFSIRRTFWICSESGPWLLAIPRYHYLCPLLLESLLASHRLPFLSCTHPSCWVGAIAQVQETRQTLLPQPQTLGVISSLGQEGRSNGFYLAFLLQFLQ